MGAIGGLGGLDGGAGGSGFGGPASASQGVVGIMNPVSGEQIEGAKAGTQNSMQAQQALLSALQGQGGIANQSSTFNQLQGVANGTGPNPAQDQYKQNINQIGAQTAGMIGSQKGISPALQARLMAQQGAGAMQNAAGQGAANQSQQQLGALGSMGALANAQVSNQIGQTNANTSAQQANQNSLFNAAGQANNANVGMQSNINNANASMANTQMQGQQNIWGGIMNTGSSALSMIGGSDRNMKKNVDEGNPKGFLDALHPHSYDYKQPDMYGHGRQLGVMAQDVEKNAPQMVLDTPQGKMLDFSKAGGPILAALANINQRLESMEGPRKKMADGGMVDDQQSAPQMDSQPTMQPQQAMPAPAIQEPPQAPQVQQPAMAPALADSGFSSSGPQSKFGQFLSTMGSVPNLPIELGSTQPAANVTKDSYPKAGGGGGGGGGSSAGASMMASGGVVPDSSFENGQSRFGTFSTDATSAVGATFNEGTPSAPTNATKDAFKMKEPKKKEKQSKDAAPNRTSDGPASQPSGGADIYQSKNYGSDAMNVSSGVDYADPNFASNLMNRQTGMARGGLVPAMVSPGEQWLPPEAVRQVTRGKNPLEVGERIPGKPKVSGNSYSNDVVPKTLEAGGVVIPNSIMQSKNPAKGAKDFVANIIAKRKGRK